MSRFETSRLSAGLPRWQLRAAALLLAIACVGATSARAAPSGAPSTKWTRPIVDAVEVVSRKASEAITFLDARPLADFLAGHPSGAVRVEWEMTRAGLFIGGKLPDDLDALARRFAALGVDDARPVVVCGLGPRGFGEEGRIAWTLRLLGHVDVALQDGGCERYRDAGGAWARGPALVQAKGTLTLRPQDESRAMKSDVVRALADPRVVIVDVRSRAEFDGATPYLEARGGHVPGALHLDWKSVFDDKGRVLRGDALSSVLRAAGVARDRPVVVYCTGGVRAALVTEVLRADGVAARNYDGSMWEWADDDTLPLVVEKSPTR